MNKYIEKKSISDKPFVSVVVPVFNMEKQLPKCIKSLLEQTFNNIEIILVNDGSTDKSGEICDQYEKSYESIRALHEVHGGVSRARNIGMKYAKGKYVLFVDADDYVDRNHVDALVDQLTKEIQVATCRVSLSGNKRTRPGKNNRVVLMGKEAIIRMMLADGLDTSVCCKLVPTCVAKRIGFNESIVVAEDAFFYYKVFREQKKVSFLDSCTYHYDSASGNTINSVTDEKIDSLSIFEEMLFAEDDIDIRESLMSKYVSTTFHFLGVLSKENSAQQKSRLKSIVFKYRSRIIKGRMIARKVKVACILSYLSFDLVLKIVRMSTANA